MSRRQQNTICTAGHRIKSILHAIEQKLHCRQYIKICTAGPKIKSAQFKHPKQMSPGSKFHKIFHVLFINPGKYYFKNVWLEIHKKYFCNKKTFFDENKTRGCLKYKTFFHFYTSGMILFLVGTLFLSSGGAKIEYKKERKTFICIKT